MIKRLLIITFSVIAISVIIYAGFIFYDIYKYGMAIAIGTKQIEMNRLNSTLENGDIIFQTSKSNQSKAIQLATGSKYSHMGIIYWQGVNLYVYEAVQPVKLTKLSEWIDRGEHRKYVVKRLKKSDEILTPENLAKMKNVGEKFKNKDYDIYFEWSDNRIYCSELVWKIYKEAFNIEIGELETLKDFNLTNPIVKQKLQERYGKNIPLNEIVISPKYIYNSDKLKTVIKN